MLPGRVLIRSKYADPCTIMRKARLRAGPLGQVADVFEFGDTESLVQAESHGRALFLRDHQDGLLAILLEFRAAGQFKVHASPTIDLESRKWSDDENGIAAIQRHCRARSRHRCVDERACRGIRSHRA